jgi:hypothetical protein
MALGTQPYRRDQPRDQQCGRAEKSRPQTEVRFFRRLWERGFRRFMIWLLKNRLRIPSGIDRCERPRLQGREPIIF